MKLLAIIKKDTTHLKLLTHIECWRAFNTHRNTCYRWKTFNSKINSVRTLSEMVNVQSIYGDDPDTAVCCRDDSLQQDKIHPQCVHTQMCTETQTMPNCSHVDMQKHIQGITQKPTRTCFCSLLHLIFNPLHRFQKYIFGNLDKINTYNCEMNAHLHFFE